MILHCDCIAEDCRYIDHGACTLEEAYFFGGACMSRRRPERFDEMMRQQNCNCEKCHDGYRTPRVTGTLK